MEFIHHPTTNMLLGKPADGSMPECKTLPATYLMDEHAGFLGIASFWKPSPEELAALNAGQTVKLMIFSQSHPPVWVGVDGL